MISADMKIDLGGKHILVTGGSRGIGAGICRQLMASGAKVAIHCNHARGAAEALAEDYPGLGQVFQADLSAASGCAHLMDEVLASFGKLDVLVNNAGVALHSELNQEEVDWLADWEKTMAVNLTAVGLLSRRAILHFQEAGKGGRLIHISSRAAFRGDTGEYLAYAASKAGMVALHRSIARGYGKVGIKSFLIAPGFVRTDMAQDFIDTYGEEYAVSDLALNRLTEPKDLAPMVAFLASGLADHATGSSIDINAGSYVH